MILPITPKYNERSLGDAQRCVNFYLEKGENGAQLVSTLGFPSTYVGSGGANGIQQVYVASTGQVFGIVNDVLYEYFNATRHNRGTLGISGGNDFRMADNGTTLIIVANNYGARRCALATSSAVTTISDANFPGSPIGAAFLDGYLIVGTLAGTFYLSALYDANDWTPVQYATAESSPDKLTDLVVVGRNLIVFGHQTIETWYNTGNPDFPLERISGGMYPFGTISGPSIQKGNGGVYFIGGDKSGGGNIYFLSPSGIEIISTPAISRRITNSTLNAWVGTFYTYEGEGIYEVSDSSIGTYAYFTKTRQWIERQSYVSSAYTANRIAKYVDYVISNVSMTLAFERDADKMYRIQPGENDEANTDIRRIYDFDQVGINGNMIFHRSFTLDVDFDPDNGVDLTLDPTLTWTDDGGLNWSTGISFSKTVTSASAQSVRFKATRLGSSRQRIYRITFTGPSAKIVVKNAEVDLVSGGIG